MPTLKIGGPDDISPNSGQLIPTTSTDQYAATLAAWFGVAPSDLATLFPNLNKFSRHRLSGLFEGQGIFNRDSSTRRWSPCPAHAERNRRAALKLGSDARSEARPSGCASAHSVQPAIARESCRSALAKVLGS